jgi:hypothetical protein
MRIAVMDFKADGVSERITRVISNMVRNRFINSGKFTVLERGQMDTILKSQGFDQLGCTDSSCAVEMGKLLSARKIMIGEVSSLGGTRILINIRIVDVEKGISEFSEEDKATSEEYVDQAAERITVKLISRISGEKVSDLKEVRIVKMTDEERSSNGFKAMGLSIIPGLGQFVYGDSFAMLEGGLFMGGSAALGYFTYSFYSDMKKKQKAYRDLPANLPQSEYDSKYDEANKSKKMFNIMAISTAGFYLLNFVDAYFAGSRPDTKTVVGYSGFSNPDGFNITLKPEIDLYTGACFAAGFSMKF